MVKKRITGRARQKTGQPFQCPWRDGDLFACSLTGSFARRAQLEGHPLLLWKTGDLAGEDGRRYPVVLLLEENGQAMKLSRRADGKFVYRTALLIRRGRQLRRGHFRYLGNYAPGPLMEDEAAVGGVPRCLKMPGELMDWLLCECVTIHRRYTQGQ